MNPYEAHWYYLKIYTGYRTSDHLLRDILYPLWKNLKEKNIVTHWFFIRYADPEYHLRYRVRLDQQGSENRVNASISDLLSQFVEKGLVWNIEEVVYVPEYERYGRNVMFAAEQVFCADSSAVSKFLRLEQGLDEHARWLYAIASVNRLLIDFSCEDDEKKTLLLELSRSFGKEFGKDKYLARQLSERYRKYRGTIRCVLTDEMPFAEILNSRSGEQKEAISMINEAGLDRKVSVRKQDLLSSFIHMSLNRIFRNNNRLHEMIIYDMLLRAYKESFYRSSNSKF